MKNGYRGSCSAPGSQVRTDADNIANNSRCQCVEGPDQESAVHVQVSSYSRDASRKTSAISSSAPGGSGYVRLDTGVKGSFWELKLNHLTARRTAVETTFHQRTIDSTGNLA